MTPNLACRVNLIRLLKKKGYRVVHEKMVVMPSNWTVATPESLALRELALLPGVASEIIGEWRKGFPVRTFAGPGNRLLSFLARAEHLGAPHFGKNIQVSDACTGCGACVGACPAGNIILDGSRPRFADRCVLCMGCLYTCPEKALTPGILKFMMIPEGYSLKKLRAKEKPAHPFDPKKEGGGLIWIGVVRYLRRYMLRQNLK